MDPQGLCEELLRWVGAGGAVYGPRRQPGDTRSQAGHGSPCRATGGAAETGPTRPVEAPLRSERASMYTRGGEGRGRGRHVAGKRGPITCRASKGDTGGRAALRSASTPLFRPEATPIRCRRRGEGPLRPRRALRSTCRCRSPPGPSLRQYVSPFSSSTVFPVH